MSTAQHTPGHDLSPRTIRAAAILAERFQNPDVAAYNRSRGGARHRAIGYIVAPSTARREHFWFCVGRALTAAYAGRGCPTDYERAVRQSINEARTKATESAAVERKPNLHPFLHLAYGTRFRMPGKKTVYRKLDATAFECIEPHEDRVKGFGGFDDVDVL